MVKEAADRVAVSGRSPFGTVILFLAAAEILYAAWGWIARLGAAPWIAGMAALFVLYGFLIRSLVRAPRVPAALILAAAVLHGLTLLVHPPVASRDLADSMGHGAAIARHGANPYAPAESLPLDPIRSTMVDPARTAQTGPAWVTLSSILALAGGGRLWLTLLLFKLLLLVALVGSGALVFSLSSRWAGRSGALPPGAAAALLVWNPLVLTRTMAEGDQAIVALAFLLLALWLTARGEGVLAAGAAAMAALTDFVMAPAAALLLLQRCKETGVRRGLVVWAVAIGVALAAFSPYLSGLTAELLLPPYWPNAAPGGAFLLLEWIAGEGATVLTTSLWAVAMLALGAFWFLLAARTGPIHRLPAQLAVFYLAAIVTGASGLGAAGVIWCSGLASLAVSATVRNSAVLLSAGASTLGMPGVSTPPHAAARLAGSLVAVGAPSLYLLHRLRRSGAEEIT